MNPPNIKKLKRELHYLNNGAEQGEKPQGLGTVEFTITCNNNSAEVLIKAHALMTDLLKIAIENWPWPDDDFWTDNLPDWFVKRCAKDITEEEAEALMQERRLLPWEERRKLAQSDKWSLSNWIYWFHPDNRYWHWWHAGILDKNTILLYVEVYEWPYPWGALSWLFRAAGAISVDSKD